MVDTKVVLKFNICPYKMVLIVIFQPQLIVKYGYYVEIHHVVTEDGFILELHRIPGSPRNPPAQGKSVFLLEHGLLCSSADWLLQGPGKSLAWKENNRIDLPSPPPFGCSTRLPTQTHHFSNQGYVQLRRGTFSASYGKGTHRMTPTRTMGREKANSQSESHTTHILHAEVKAYLLADRGFDVWLGNARGNTYSRRHVRLSPKDPQFWNHEPLVLSSAFVKHILWDCERDGESRSVASQPTKVSFRANKNRWITEIVDQTEHRITVKTCKFSNLSKNDDINDNKHQGVVGDLKNLSQSPGESLGLRLELDDTQCKYFGWHHMGMFDLPAEIDYILQNTQQQSLYYAGHSMGTTKFFVMASKRPEYNLKIRTMFALAPIVFMSHMQSPFKRLAFAGETLFVSTGTS
uniref:(California timema) hypothetical protein n=1 Tax=Timema californicum TaxID=61474 RepID=A0A7R9JBG9_TIMCA|nr:unnamed protein product [Timema californicum]